MTQGAKPVLAVDVDDVLFPLVPLFADYHNKHHGTDLTPQHFDKYVFEDVMGVSTEEFIKRFRQFGGQGGFSTSDVVDQAKEAIVRLSAHYDLVVITSRWPDWEEETISWLKLHFADAFGQVHFANSVTNKGRARNKASICQEIGASILIDDSLENLESCAEIGVKGLLFGEHAWNQSEELPSNIQRVKDWNEVLEVLL